jgi:hypothetical protein
MSKSKDSLRDNAIITVLKTIIDSLGDGEARIESWRGSHRGFENIHIGLSMDDQVLTTVLETIPDSLRDVKRPSRS